MYRGREAARTPGGTGLQYFSTRTLFFPPRGCTLSFCSLLSSHSGTGSLTAAATELDGFYLLWLEKTLFMLWTHTHTCTHTCFVKCICIHGHKNMQGLNKLILNVSIITFRVVSVIAAVNQQVEQFPTTFSATAPPAG